VKNLSQIPSQGQHFFRMPSLASTMPAQHPPWPPATPRPRLLPLAPVVISDAFVFALALALGFALGFTFGFAFDFAFDLDGALAAAAAAVGNGGCRGGGGEGSGGGGGIAAEEEAILVARARRMCGADSAMPPRPP
jgi:hypothetical protein